MTNDQPPSGPPPEDDPFRKKNDEEGRPGGRTGQGAAGTPGEPRDPWGPEGPASGASQQPPQGSPYGSPPPPPYGGSDFGGEPFGGGEPRTGMPPVAPFGRRLLARVIDALIVAIPLTVLSLLVGGWRTTPGGSEFNDFSTQVNSGRQWVWSIISIIAFVGYDTLMTRRSGQTLGKRWLKLRVAVLENGAVPDANSSLLRAAVLWLPALICCFVVWWLIIIATILASRPYKQGLHDKAARTVVVSAPQ